MNDSNMIMMDNKIKYVECEPWMLDQVAELAVLQYGGNVDDRKKHYEHLLCNQYSLIHPPIALVGLSGRNKVIAFQSYLYWPYKKGETQFNVYQSGGSLVHPSFRGQKIFQNLLSIGSMIALQKKADFLTGFPIPISYGALIKDGWIKVGHLRWWTKILRPIRLIREKYGNNICNERNYDGMHIDIRKIIYYSGIDVSIMRMANSEDFLEWRYNQKINDYWYYEHHSAGCMFLYKLSCVHGYSEIVIGDTFIRNNEKDIFANTLKNFLNKKNKSIANISAVSFASFNPSPLKMRGLLLNGFIPHKLTAPLLIKPISKNIKVNKSEWDVSLCDIDTW